MATSARSTLYGRFRLSFLSFLLWGAIALAAVAMVVVFPAIRDHPDRAAGSASDASIPLAILGDSDSHSFQDGFSFGDTPAARGGAYRSNTFNWLEILARLRGDRIDPGEWGTWGNTRERYAIIREALGMRGRLPRKQDYRYNFAFSGARCSHLTSGRYRQAPRLLASMDEDPAPWRKGIVVIRIGVNSFGNGESLEALARDPQSAQVVAEMENCVAAHRQAIHSIRARHPDTRFVLVGIFNNSHWPKLLDKWRTPAELANIATGLDRFDRGLREIVAGNPAHLVFFDDRAWFDNHWGSRGADGHPAYKDIVLDGQFIVRNTAGDDPSNSVLQDGHAGTVWNGLWAQSMIQLLNAHFSLDIREMTDAEILQLLDTRARAGLEGTG